MSQNHLRYAYQNMLEVDRDSINELRRLIAQAKTEGTPTNKLHKDLVAAYEKQVKHLKEYEKWQQASTPTANAPQPEIAIQENNKIKTSQNSETHSTPEEPNVSATPQNQEPLANQEPPLPESHCTQPSPANDPPQDQQQEPISNTSLLNRSAKRQLERELKRKARFQNKQKNNFAKNRKTRELNLEDECQIVM